MAERADTFVSVIAAPPGPPWVQVRAARIAAELEAPLASEALEIAMTRLTPWTPMAPARIAIAYLRATEEPIKRQRTLVIDEREVRFVFQSRAWAARRRRRLRLTLALVCGLVLGLGCGGARWLSIRATLEANLEARANIARRELSVARRQRDLAHRLALMRESQVRGRSGAKVAEDLAWLGAHREPGGAINAVTWREGRLLIDAKTAPISTSSPEGAGRWSLQPPPSGGAPAATSKQGLATGGIP